MLPEKYYWIILISGFIVSGFFIEFVLIPYEILDYNLGINLISEIIGILLTVVFLILLLNMREKMKWKKVEQTVLTEIGGVLENIFRVIVLYYKNGMTDFFLFRRSKPDVNEVFSAHLRKLIKKEIPVERTTVKLLYEHPELLEHHFSDPSHRLSEIEAKYFKFLSPEIISSIINIRNCISGLEYLVRAHLNVERLEKLLSKKNVSKKEGKIEIMPSDFFERIATGFFEGILKEIDSLQKLGIEIYPRKT